MLTGAISAVLARVEVIHSLEFLYICSYIKLAVTSIKYIPQVKHYTHLWIICFAQTDFVTFVKAYMNHQRKSTSGWCIGNVLLDFSGGILSMLEMMLNAYNYGKLTKYCSCEKHQIHFNEVIIHHLECFSSSIRWLGVNFWWSDQIRSGPIFSDVWYFVYAAALYFI